MRSIDNAIANDAFPPSNDEMRAFHAALYQTYERFDSDHLRPAFEAIAGVKWGWFVSLIDVLGWRLLPDDRKREFWNQPDRLITPEDVAG